MTIALTALSLLLENRVPWIADWVWGVPLIVVTLIIHVVVLGITTQRAIVLLDGGARGRPSVRAAAMVMALVTILATILHALEAGIWALAYCALGAIDTFKAAMLFSMGAMTTYGGGRPLVEEHWHMLGAIEALNGWLLFGLSSAFLFWLIQGVSPKRV
jgi:hypothetical protein